MFRIRSTIFYPFALQIHVKTSTFLNQRRMVKDSITGDFRNLKQIMKEIMSPHRAQSEEFLQGLNLGMFGMLYICIVICMGYLQ